MGFLLGGAFVFLQYMASRGLVNVDWRSMARRYDTVVDGYAGAGAGSRLSRVGGRALDFLGLDFRVGCQCVDESNRELTVHLTTHLWRLHSRRLSVHLMLSRRRLVAGMATFINKLAL